MNDNENRKRKVRSRNVNKIINNDYTLSKYDFYPPPDKRKLPKSELLDIYDGINNACYRYRAYYNRILEDEETYERFF